MALVASIVAKDMGSTTGRNLFKLSEETGLNPWKASSSMIREALESNIARVPDVDFWRLPLLEKLLHQRYQMENELQETDKLQELVDSLCSS